MSYTHFDSVSANSPQNLARLVQARIDDGWQPHGHMIATPEFNPEGAYSIAMVKGAPVLGTVELADVIGLEDALDAKADLEEGTVPVAQLPLATTESVGVVSVGAGLAVDGSGELTVDA